MLLHITSQSPSEVWLVEHFPVYTKGRLSQDSHVKKANQIPIVDTDRGGQMTYHGPGQMIVYPILKLDDWNLSPKSLVNLLEDTTLITLKDYGIESYGDPNARGVYINGEKIASIGLKIKQGYSYHGIAINLSVDLSPFSDIVICGNPHLIMTKLENFTNPKGFEKRWLEVFIEKLHMNRYNR